MKSPTSALLISGDSPYRIVCNENTKLHEVYEKGKKWEVPFVTLDEAYGALHTIHHALHDATITANHMGSSFD